MTNIKSKIKRFGKYFFGKQAYRFILKDWGPLFDDQKKAADVLSTMRHFQQIEAFELAYPEGKEFLVIAPHPDDESVGPGGTLLKMTDNGAKITILFLTSGKKGEENIREKECKTIAKKLGCKVLFLQKNANNLTCDDETLNSVSLAVQNYGRDGVFVTFLLDDHPDHRKASELLYLSYLQGKIAHKTQIWAYQVYTSVLPNVVIDITDVSKRKKQLIEIHQSQFVYRNWGHYTLGLNAFNSRFLKNRKNEAYAEIFLNLPMEGYAALCQTYFK